MSTRPNEIDYVMRQRREAVEHPFGTIKARMGATRPITDSCTATWPQRRLHTGCFFDLERTEKPPRSVWIGPLRKPHSSAFCASQAGPTPQKAIPERGRTVLAFLANLKFSIHFEVSPVRAASENKYLECPPSALMRLIGWVEEGRISGSS
jgi:hypothetical protein